MRIDSNQPSASLPERSAAAAGESGAASFTELLQNLTREAPPKPEARPSPAPDLLYYAEQRSIRAEIRAEHAEVHEDRHEDYLDGIEDSQDMMEDLVEDWKERSPHRTKDEPGATNENDENSPEVDLSEIIASDDVGELISDFDERLLDDNEQNEQQANSGGSRGSQQFTEDPESRSSDHQERELNFQEIQTLVETTLASDKKLPPRVRHSLKELLGALLGGQRWLLDQHRLIGLERSEWTLIQQLFPAHFYAGLVRQHRHSDLPLYDLLQDLFAQVPPDSDRQQELLALWQPGLGESLLLRNWLLDQPLLVHDAELVNLLELWQHQQALPPGATGRTLQLALAYRHHPERMQTLFLIARHLLHGQALSLKQTEVLAQCISERCFQRELTDTEQIQELMIKALHGKELSEQELMQMLAGCSQGVLSHLPYDRVHDSLRDLQDYVRQDLLGREEQVLTLLREEESTLPL
jgi:hypothetical protein